MMHADWSPAKIERLRTLWGEGHTAWKIAEMFGDGRSRNSIIGKVHSLGLTRPRREPKKRDRESGVMRSGVRKAYASKGDDNLTRFVKIDTAEKPRKHRRNPKLPGMESAFIVEGRTKFPKSVKTYAEHPHILVSGHSNVKIGRDVRKAKFRGYWIYTLTLEERKTCPLSCKHWQTCYGNNMPFPTRHDHTDPEFLPALEAEIATLCRKKLGVLVRLHALGDFFSVEYVAFWDRMLRKHANLAVYGYTARNNEDEIGPAVFRLRNRWKDRAMIRSSDGARHNMATVSIGDETGCPPNAFICPEQTGKTRCCATCGACWSTTKNVAFMEH